MAGTDEGYTRNGQVDQLGTSTALRRVARKFMRTRLDISEDCCLQLHDQQADPVEMSVSICVLTVIKEQARRSEV